jgi:hypothetical protein
LSHLNGDGNLLTVGKSELMGAEVLKSTSHNKQAIGINTLPYLNHLSESFLQKIIEGVNVRLRQVLQILKMKNLSKLAIISF